jgi:CHAD domain-containing protein
MPKPSPTETAPTETDLASVRKARPVDYPRDVDAGAALGAVLDECILQISHNALGLVAGDESLRAAHLHQLRVGIRRLRSGLRSFEGWAPAPPGELVDELRGLFAQLGRARDSDVLDSGVAADLVKAGAPRLRLRAVDAVPDPAELLRRPSSQKALLAWLTWRSGVVAAAPGQRHGGGAKSFHRDVERRLGRWHRRIAAASRRFDQLDEESLHALRKRIKRQRYAVEFFAPVLRRKATGRYLDPLASIQERMGELNDLFVARKRYRSLVDSDPAAWFALGWLAAQIPQVRLLAKPELERLARTDPPRT